jgi:hypothetical protein
MASANWRRHRHLSAEFSNISAKDDMAMGGESVTLAPVKTAFL